MRSIRPRLLAGLAALLLLSGAAGSVVYSRHAQREGKYAALQRSRDELRRLTGDAAAARTAYDRAFDAAASAERKRHELAIGGGWSTGGELAYARQEDARIRAALALHRRFVEKLRQLADRYAAVTGVDVKPARATIAAFDASRERELSAWRAAIDGVIGGYAGRRGRPPLASIESSYFEAEVQHRAAERRFRSVTTQLGVFVDRLDGELRLADTERRRVL